MLYVLGYVYDLWALIIFYFNDNSVCTWNEGFIILKRFFCYYVSDLIAVFLLCSISLQKMIFLQNLLN